MNVDLSGSTMASGHLYILMATVANLLENPFIGAWSRNANDDPASLEIAGLNNRARLRSVLVSRDAESSERSARRWT
jgi:hypothetical protein